VQIPFPPSTKVLSLATSAEVASVMDAEWEVGGSFRPPGLHWASLPPPYLLQLIVLSLRPTSCR
jgi:hypothetical protein